MDEWTQILEAQASGSEVQPERLPIPPQTVLIEEVDDAEAYRDYLDEADYVSDFIRYNGG